MKNPIHIISVFILCVIVYGCTSEAEPIPIPEDQLPDFVSKLVVNSSINNKEVIEIKISDNAGAYEDSLPKVYEDVTLSLTADGSTVSMTYDNASRSYKSSQKAVPGKTYKLEVRDLALKKQTVVARSFMPEKVFGKSVGYIENGGIDLDGFPSDLLSIEWTDISGNNYYMLHFYYYSETVGLYIPFDFQITDATLKAPETMKLDDGGFLFNDVLFNGSTKRIEVVPPGGLVAGNSDELYLIELRSVTKDFYTYYKTLQQYRDRDDLQQAGPFGSAVIVHSNITNGLGAFISSTIESDTIR
jgi:hypothetical protein